MHVNHSAMGSWWAKVHSMFADDYNVAFVSGVANVGEAGADGYGTILSGSLERSNVDITEELVNLITAQRNFQANAKSIETNSTITQAIINIRN